MLCAADAAAGTLAYVPRHLREGAWRDWQLGEAEATGDRADPVSGRRTDLIVSFLTAPG
jgi:hypothetical protein